MKIFAKDIIVTAENLRELLSKAFLQATGNSVPDSLEIGEYGTLYEADLPLPESCKAAFLQALANGMEERKGDRGGYRVDKGARLLLVPERPDEVQINFPGELGSSDFKVIPPKIS